MKIVTAEIKGRKQELWIRKGRFFPYKKMEAGLVGLIFILLLIGAFILGAIWRVNSL